MIEPPVPAHDFAEDRFPCEHCDGDFLPHDLDGTFCRACSEALFGDEP